MTIDVSELSLGRTLGTGGQGSVIELTNSPDTVFKRYHNPADPHFEPTSLERLVKERTNINLAGEPVDSWATWPHTVVNHHQRPIGFLMRRVPADFTLATTRGEGRLADLSFLAARPSPLWADLALPSDEERVGILHQLARAMQALHQRRIVVGDVSFGNILWSCAPRARVMLLDCDGMRPEGQPPVLPQAGTVDWDDPLAVGPMATSDQDCYKLALAVVRVLRRSIDARPTGTTPPELRGLSVQKRTMVAGLLARAAGPAGSRPPARAWVQVLSGRPTIPVEAAESHPRSVEAPAPKPDLIAGGNRRYQPTRPARP